MKMSRFLPALRRFLPLLLLSLALASAHAQIVNPPQTMSFQGYLTDGNGNPLGATNVGPKNYTVVFRIFDSANNGNELYADQQTVVVNNGSFSVLLGQGSSYNSEPHTSTPSSLFVGATAASRYVEMMVVGIGPSLQPNVTIAPRLQLVSSPYAYLAANAVTAGTAGGLVNAATTGAAVTVSTSGNVGIGTVNPSSLFEVNGNATIDNLLTVGGGGINDNAQLSCYSLYDTGNAVVQGNVGIGTAASNIPLSFPNVVGEKISLYPGGAGPIGFGIQANLLQIHTDTPSTDIGFGYGSSSSFTEKMRIAGNGNVGIGTTSPGALLDIQGANNRGTGLRVIGSQAGIYLYNSNPNAGNWNIWNTQASDPQSPAGTMGSLQFYSDKTSKTPLYLTQSGNVGINTVVPAHTLDVAGNGGFTGVLDLDTTATANWANGTASLTSGAGIRFGSGTSGEGIICNRVNNSQNQYGLTFVTASSARLVVAANGNVGIGTMSPRFPLEVASTIATNSSPNGAAFFRVNQAFNALNGYSANQPVTCSIFAAASVMTADSFIAISDARVKEIVGRSDSRQDLATVCKLKITDYRKIDKVQYGGRLQKGVIAQEVQAVIPEAVSTSTNFIPDIYALPSSFGCTNGILEVTMARPHGLIVGDLVKYITDAGEVQTQVTAVKSPLVFAVADMSGAPKRLFVYGKQVGDLHEVNYDRLFTTGLGAIQELAKRADAADARAERLAGEVAELKKLVTQLADAAKSSKLTASAANVSAKTVASASLDR